MSSCLIVENGHIGLCTTHKLAESGKKELKHPGRKQKDSALNLMKQPLTAYLQGPYLQAYLQPYLQAGTENLG